MTRLLGVLLIALSSSLLLSCGSAATPRKHPPDVAFVFETSYGERIDMIRGLVTKDLIALPDTTVSLRFTPAELDTIYDAMVRMGFFDLPEPHPRIETEWSSDGSTTTRLMAMRRTAQHHAAYRELPSPEGAYY